MLKNLLSEGIFLLTHIFFVSFPKEISRLELGFTVFQMSNSLNQNTFSVQAIITLKSNTNEVESFEILCQCTFVFEFIVHKITEMEYRRSN